VSGRPLVLVADDDPDILNLVTLRLELDGYEVVGARDGEDASVRSSAHPISRSSTSRCRSSTGTR
jgi:DNA-binding response OmpR family regulator